jgi:dihydroorotase
MQIKEIKGQILLKNATIIDPFKDKTYETDILIEKGKIKRIDKNIEAEQIKNIVDIKGQVVSPGFIDIHAHFREPGQEDKETIETGARAALAGGYTQVCCMPNTIPSIDTQEVVKFIYKKAEHLPVKVYPIAAITKGRIGEKLTEMADLSDAGAVAFSDDGTPLQNSLMMRYALEYSKIVDKPIINHAEDVNLRADGIMNEGAVSAQLGLPGNPAIAEEMMIHRDLALADFTKAKIHIPHVTTRGGVELIRRAKKSYVKVTAEVTPHHFSLTDEYIKSFDANGKVAPPLRTGRDRMAIIEGLKDGTIDAIATDHAPHKIEEKETTLDLAANGMIGLETAFALAMTNIVHTGHLSLMEVIKKLTVNPAKIMGINLPKLKEKEEANLTIFDPDEWWVFSKKDIYSKSHNSPFIGAEFTGRVKSVVTGLYYVTL